MLPINFLYLVLLMNQFYTLQVAGTRANMTGKVIGGEYVSIEKYPYAVLINVIRKDGCMNLCGSSVLNQFLLLTAAHCFDDHDKREAHYAYAGHADIEQMTLSRKIVKVFIHEDYRSSSVQNDIAMLLLNKKLPLRTTIQRVLIKQNLPSYRDAPELFLAGWGLINEKDNTRAVWLKAVDQTLQNPKKCNAVFHNKHPGLFCAGSKDKKSRPALGDSGSGLVTADFQLLGILAFKSSSQESLPFYTSIAYFYKWIKRTASKADAAYCLLHKKKRN